MALNKQQHTFIRHHTHAQLTPVSAGHMLYHRLVSDEPDGWFIKAFDQELFTNDTKRYEAANYLRKEANVYQHLATHAYPHIPKKYAFNHNVLLLTAHHPHQGWYWRAPKAQLPQYLADTFTALTALEKVPNVHRIDPGMTLEYLWVNGWGSKKSLSDSLRQSLKHWEAQLTPANLKEAKKLLLHPHQHRQHDALISDGTFSHHDMRQSNFAWHPYHGTVIVDWSWAGQGVKNADTTMLLIDLHKAGHDISSYLSSYFNSEYASLMMCYWIMRHDAISAGGNDIVRLHQLVSALSAFELLELTAAS